MSFDWLVCEEGSQRRVNREGIFHRLEGELDSRNLIQLSPYLNA